MRLYSLIVFNIDTDGLQIGLWELEGDLLAGKFLVDSRESIGLGKKKTISSSIPKEQGIALPCVQCWSADSCPDAP